MDVLNVHSTNCTILALKCNHQMERNLKEDLQNLKAEKQFFCTFTTTMEVRIVCNLISILLTFLESENPSSVGAKGATTTPVCC